MAERDLADAEHQTLLDTLKAWVTTAGSVVRTA